MSERQQPDPGEGWRLASGDDYKDERCQYWNDCMKAWMPRPPYITGCPFSFENYYRIPDGAQQPATSRDTEEQVCDDIKARQRLGVAKYGTNVADNPLSLLAWLQHAYEECLDQAVYLRRAITEIETKEATK